MNKFFHKFAAAGAHLNGLPVLNATILDDEDGMLRISLVDYPAVESDFLAFKAAKKAASYRVLDEDRRLVYGVVMRADFPIYRCDPQNGEYFIVYTAETVRTMAEKYLADGRQNRVNIMHLAGSDQEGIHMVQWFLKDTAAGVNPAGFEAIEDGSLFAEFHVQNEEVWLAIKDGTYRGFSIEVINGMQPAMTEDFRSQVEAILNNSNIEDMSKLQFIKNLLHKAVDKFKSVNTDKGALEWDGEEDAKVGTKVYVPATDEAARAAAADGEYRLDDGTVLVVKDGEVTEIRPAEAPAQDPEPDPDPANLDTDPAPADPADPEPAQEPDLAARVADLEADNAALREELEGLEDILERVINRLSELGVQMEAFAKKPAADDARKRFRGEPKKKGATGVDRLKAILG